MRLPKLIFIPLLFIFCSCDWFYYAFVNSIPFHGDASKNRDVYVYLGVDGLSYFTAEEAVKRGVIAGSEWKLSKFISGFPGTSDASWTRIMHTQDLPGYEIQYYDPIKDVMVNQGVLGLAEHITPSISKTLSFAPEYLSAFDFIANGFNHTLESYMDTHVSFANTVDNVFTILEGRSETRSVFSAYILELDVLGHLQSTQDVSQCFNYLFKKIEAFRKNHPERNYHFTLFSDHGLDFIKVAPERLTHLDEEMVKVGITPVKGLKNHDPKSELYAVPVIHTRVTYVALHTHPDLAEKVAEKASLIPAIDLSIARFKLQTKEEGIQRFGIWKEGQLILAFGFDAKTNQYLISEEYNTASLGFDLPSSVGRFSDRELFHLTKDKTYPDLFYRVRTALSGVGCKYPAEVLTSFKPGFVSLGFQLFGADAGTATSGFHGSLEYRGTLGTLLTNEKNIPDAVRSDALLDLFPRLKNHVQKLGIEIQAGDPFATVE